MATVAPKDKTFSTTKSLEDRAGYVAIIDSLGYNMGIRRILDQVTGRKDYKLPSQFEQWLLIKDNNYNNNKARISSPAFKKVRAEKRASNIRDKLEKDRKNKKAREGHGTGIALEDDDDEGEGAAPAPAPAPAPASIATAPASGATASAVATASDGTAAATTTAVKICPYCMQPGHLRKTSKKCLFYKKQNKSE